MIHGSDTSEVPINKIKGYKLLYKKVSSTRILRCESCPAYNHVLNYRSCFAMKSVSSPCNLSLFYKNPYQRLHHGGSFSDVVNEKNCSNPVPLGRACVVLREIPNIVLGRASIRAPTPEGQRTLDISAEHKEETQLGFAIRVAKRVWADVSWFHTSRVLSRAEDYGDLAMLPKYWHLKALYYDAM